LTNSEISENIFSLQIYKMDSGRLVLLIAVAALVHSFGESMGEGLEAKLAGAKLPTTLEYSTAVYDGSDSVYILGG
jgi:hypothetical protein